MDYDPIKTRRAFREKQLACKMCVNARPPSWGKTTKIIASPRHGTGPMDGTAKLMIIGQNPPLDPARCLHGAWMLHYRTPEFEKDKGSHEKLVDELVSQRLGLDVMKEVYATQVVKCPTYENATPQCFEATACTRQWLRTEFMLVRPAAVLAFGVEARMASLGHFYGDHGLTLPSGKRETYSNEWEIPFSVPLTPVGNAHPTKVEVRGHVILAPHPSQVDRFIVRSSWLAGIAKAYQHVMNSGLAKPDVLMDQLLAIL